MRRIALVFPSRATHTTWYAVLCLILLSSFSSISSPVHAQRVEKYGAEFLATGVGGRALGMGGTHIGIVRDVSAVYWNPAGMAGVEYAEIAYMHDERFAGNVSFDYAGGVLPISRQSTVGLAIVRSGVDDIPNTLNAYDFELGQPRANPENFIERFSAVDYGFFLSYARLITDDISVGVTGKLIRQSIGDFADAWGYSFDVGVQWAKGRWLLGANAQDLSTMLKSWSVNQEELANLPEFPGEVELPEGGTSLVLPVLRLGAGYTMPMKQSALVFALDMDVVFDGQQAFALNTGEISYHPRLGVEYTYNDVIALRGGINRLLVSDDIGFDVTPNVGAGLRLNQFSIDYGFGDFAGVSSDLGFSHRIAARLVLQQPKLKRPTD